MTEIREKIAEVLLAALGNYHVLSGRLTIEQTRKAADAVLSLLSQSSPSGEAAPPSNQSPQEGMVTVYEPYPGAFDDILGPDDSHSQEQEKGGKSQTHELKTAPHLWDAIERGEKTFEIRRDDRAFQEGDVLRLYRSTDAFGWKSKDVPSLDRTVSFILTGGQYGVEPGYVIMGFAPSSRSQEQEKGV